MDLAGSEKYESFENNFAEERPKSWQFEEMKVKYKDRIKEGKYINKSLFFLTQVISKKGHERLS